jgi:hypothetical protein
MTKRDFELIASVIRDKLAVETQLYVAAVFADALAKTNPRFDRPRFILACRS